MRATEEARRVIEAAVMGISGAAHRRDESYARYRYAELLAAGLRLGDLDQVVLSVKAGRQLRACARGDVAAAQRLASEIIRLISFCS